MIPAGRRSGKTERAKRYLIHALLKWRGRFGPSYYFAAAPTRDQAKRIFWDDLKALVPKANIASIRETALTIVTNAGNELHVVGLNVPQRVEGTPWDGGIVDEFADCPAGMFPKHIRPALGDRYGWCWLMGVPDMDAPGQIEYEEMVNGANSRSPEWADWECFSWPTAEILPFVLGKQKAEEELRSARATMDARTFEQEYLGKFVLAGGRAFSDFDPAVGGLHVRPTPYDPALPICWSLDFNVAPFCTGIIQHKAGQVRVIAELVLGSEGRTEIMCDAFLELAQQRQWNLKNLTVYGDPAGHGTHTVAAHSGASDWAIIQNKLHNHLAPGSVRVHKGPQPIADTKNAVNARIKSADGTANLVIDPGCRKLIEDLRAALWPGTMDEQHAAAWLRYFCHFAYPVHVKPRDSGGRVIFSNA